MSAGKGDKRRDDFKKFQASIYWERKANKAHEDRPDCDCLACRVSGTRYGMTERALPKCEDAREAIKNWPHKP